MRRVAVGRASASKELCCASRSIRFACNDHRRGHSKTILIGFWPFLTNYLLIYTLTFSKVVIPRKEFWFASHSQTNEKLSAHKQYEELFLSVWRWEANQNYFWYFSLLILNIDKKIADHPSCQRSFWMAIVDHPRLFTTTANDEGNMSFFIDHYPLEQLCIMIIECLIFSKLPRVMQIGVWIAFRRIRQ